MKMPIKEFASLSGVSVRTLHYYDEIGLLKPASVDKYTGYRYYDNQSFLRMQEILFYRELDFSLKRIQEILSSPNYNTSKALEEQKKLLTLKKERLERLIAAIDGAAKGENVMNAFSSNEYDRYKAEVTEKWGKTEAYREHTEKTKNYTKALTISSRISQKQRKAVKAPVLPGYRSLCVICSSILPTTTTPVPIRSWQALARCTSLTIDSKIISTDTAQEPPILSAKPFLFTANKSHNKTGLR